MYLFKIRRCWIESHSDIVDIEAEDSNEAIEIALQDTEMNSDHLTYEDTLDVHGEIVEQNEI